MRIGYFCYNLSGTGPRVRAQDIINGFAARTDHDVVVLTSEPGLVDDGADIVVEVDIRNPVSVFRSVRRYLTDCDVVHVPINVYQVAFVRAGYRGPLVAGIGPGLQSDRRHRLLLRMLDIDARIKTFERQFELPINGLTATVTGTIDTASFYPYTPEECVAARERLEIPTDDRVLLYVGELNEPQGARLVDSMADRFTRPDTTIVVAGGGPLADRMAVNEHIQFEGFVPNKQLPTYYNAADVTLGPRRNDVTSNVGLESIACGAPFITTATGTIRSLFLYEEDIYCWADRTPDGVWRTAQSLLDDEAAYEGYVRRGLEAIAKRPLTLERALSVHEELYTTLATQ